ncbi:MAG: DUF4097 family beta strand repeat-containing protein [Thermoanaerobaculales bacterium]
MRRIVPLIAALVLLPVIACVRPGPPTRTRETRTFPAAADKLVKVDLRSLDMTVTVAESNVITAAVNLEAQSSSRTAARRWVERNTPLFDDSASTLEIRQPTRQGTVIMFGFMHNRGSLELTVPPACRLEIHTSSGDVTLRGETTVSGPVRVDTSSGDVTVRGGARELVIRTSSGDVLVSAGKLIGFEADTSSGDITLNGGSERTLVETSSGEIRLDKLAGGLSADASSGDIRATWESLAPGLKVRVHSSSGDVRLRVPAATGLLGEITTTSGTISCDFPGNSDRREHHFTLTSPAPAADFEVHTSSGDVTLRKSAP